MKNGIFLIVFLIFTFIQNGHSQENITYSTNESGEVSYHYEPTVPEKGEDLNTDPDRYLYFPARISAAVELSVGISYLRDSRVRFSFLAGVSGLFYPDLDTVFFTDMWAEYVLVNLLRFDFVVKGGFFTYFYPDRPTANPAIAIELQFWKVFIEMGVRYSALSDYHFIPIVGLGMRF